MSHPIHGLILLATHTDDTLIYAKQGKTTIDWLHNELTASDKCNLRLSNWGKAETFLGMKFEQNVEHPTKKGIFISCPGALQEWGKTYNRPEETQSTINSEKFDEIIKEEWGGDSLALTPDEQRIQAMLQSVVSAMRHYAAACRHDVLYTCSRLATRFNSPTQAVLIDEAFHTTDYMRGTADQGPYYPRQVLL